MEQVAAKNLAEKLFDQHLPEAEYPQWSFMFDNAKRRAGNCNFTERVISVSRHYVSLNSEREIEQTLLHEIAHAIAGYKAAHGPKWVSVARSIGFEGGRYCKGNSPKGKWRMICGACGNVMRDSVHKRMARHKLARRRHINCPATASCGHLMYVPREQKVGR